MCPLTQQPLEVKQHNMIDSAPLVVHPDGLAWGGEEGHLLCVVWVPALIRDPAHSCCNYCTRRDAHLAAVQ
jgi:hypothetical protein